MAIISKFAEVSKKRVAIIGAGPVGLAAAAHALERGLDPLVIERGHGAGHAVRQWGHVRMFSPWQYNVDAAATRLLSTAGWSAPEDSGYPTGAELVERYLEPLAQLPALAGRILTNATVIGLSRKGFDKLRSAGREAAPFEILLESGGHVEIIEAQAVIDASGTWHAPAPAGSNGLAASGEVQCRDHIAYGMPDVSVTARQIYRGRRTAVLGSGHSALGVLLDLARMNGDDAAVRPVWLTRRSNIETAFGGGAADQLAERGAIGLAFADLVRSGRIEVQSDFRLTQIAHTGDALVLQGPNGRVITAERLVVSTGFRPDFSFLGELRVSLDPVVESTPALAPLIDPNEHSCGTVRPHGARELAHPEPGFYIAGMKSYGRAPTFLMLTGYEQVRSITAALAGDHEAAAQVELVLPETGVCSGPAEESAASCCGPVPSAAPAPKPARCCG